MGAVDSYSAAVHTVSAAQARSLVADGAPDSYSLLVQAVHGLHALWFATALNVPASQGEQARSRLLEPGVEA